MAKEVIGRGGKHQPFRAEKIKKSIRLACKDAHIPGARIKRVVSKVSRPVLKFAAKRKTVKTSVIRTKVLTGLRKAEPAAAKAWMKYEKRRHARRKR
jgi:transcriptional regulator NrdR family protein